MELAPESQKLIDAYLYELEVQLAECHAIEVCRERVNEMRPHLISMCQARLELGDDPVRAVQSSIVRFGNPIQMALTTTREPRQEVREAILFLVFLGLMAVYGMAFPLWLPENFRPPLLPLGAFATLFSARAWFTRNSPMVYTRNLCAIILIPYSAFTIFEGIRHGFGWGYPYWYVFPSLTALFTFSTGMVGAILACYLKQAGRPQPMIN